MARIKITYKDDWLQIKEVNKVWLRMQIPGGLHHTTITTGWFDHIQFRIHIYPKSAPIPVLEIETYHPLGTEHAKPIDLGNNEFQRERRGGTRERRKVVEG